MASTVRARALFDATIVRQAIVDSFRKLTPRRQVRNPVMFVVYVGSILTTLLWGQALVGQGEAPGWFIFWVSVWLWFTVLFANFAEAMAEGRGKAQAASLRKARRDLQAKRLARPERSARFEFVSASQLRKGQHVLVEAGEFIPADGTAVEGVVGSALIGQPFDDPKYFWGRPSATSPFGYNAGSSVGSNLSPTNADLIKTVQGRVDALKAADPGNTAPVPVDLVTASGSGLDPHISPAAALYQVERVAKARKMSADDVRALVDRHTEGRQLGLLGERRVNVLALNLALDAR
jgi:potassium-transporting ATPase KdpC subunit